MSGRDWCVMRQDDDGNRFVVASALTEPEARLLSVSYGVRLHNQKYWVEPMASAESATMAKPALPDPRS